jgi:hypothetical protein
MSKARKVLSNTIVELIKETPLESRVRISCWFALNNMIHDSGARKESVWDETNPIDVKLMELLEDKTEDLTKKIMENIKEWEEDGKPK